MADQWTAEQLFLVPLNPSLSAGDMADQFAEFHRRNPAVYSAIVRIAFELKRRGFRHCGMKMIFERLRWLYSIQTTGDDYKLNNNFTAYYARLVMEREPELRGFFRVRSQRDPIDLSITVDGRRVEPTFAMLGCDPVCPNGHPLTEAEIEAGSCWTCGYNYGGDDGQES